MSIETKLVRMAKELLFGQGYKIDEITTKTIKNRHHLVISGYGENIILGIVAVELSVAHLTDAITDKYTINVRTIQEKRMQIERKKMAEEEVWLDNCIKMVSEKPTTTSKKQTNELSCGGITNE